MPPAAPASRRRGRRGGKKTSDTAAPGDTAPQYQCRLGAHTHKTRSQGPGGPARSPHTRVRSHACPFWPRSPQQPSAARACVWRSRRIIGRGAVGDRARSPNPLALALSCARAPRLGAPAMTARVAGDAGPRMRPHQWPSTPQRVPQRPRPGGVAAQPHTSKHTAARLSRSKSHLQPPPPALLLRVSFKGENLSGSGEQRVLSGPVGPRSPMMLETSRCGRLSSAQH